MSDHKQANIDKTDKLYATPQEVSSFDFNQQVVDVFPDMISRSVPGYEKIIEGIGDICARWLSHHTTSLEGSRPVVVYDLGCSLGSASLSIAKQFKDVAHKIIGVDKSAAMIARCKTKIKAMNHGAHIDIVEADLNTIELQACDIVVMNFTLQFIDKPLRQSLIDKIFHNLKPGGLFIISEKVTHVSQQIDDMLIHLHHKFKKRNGYSDLEISQKRTALEDVMKLDTVPTHYERLFKAGFTHSSIWHQQLNFLSIMAIK